MLIGAYSDEGAAWVDECRAVIAGNAQWLCDWVESTWPGVDVTRPQGTYIVLLNCEKWCSEHGVTNDELVQRAWDVGVAWHDGRLFGAPWCVRLNIALPLDQLQEAFARLTEHVFV